MADLLQNMKHKNKILRGAWPFLFWTVDHSWAEKALEIFGHTYSFILITNHPQEYVKSQNISQVQKWMNEFPTQVIHLQNYKEKYP